MAWRTAELLSLTSLQGHLVVIDVSQSVDLDHPQALHFLREDAAHVNTFFCTRVPALTTRELFEFAVDPSITPGNLSSALDGLRQAAASRSPARRLELEQQDAVSCAACCFAVHC